MTSWATGKSLTSTLVIPSWLAKISIESRQRKIPSWGLATPGLAATVGAVFFVWSRFNRNAVMPSSLKFQQRPVFYFTRRVSLEGR
jgi:hypothetical protein